MYRNVLQFHPVQTKQKTRHLEKQIQREMKEKQKLCEGRIYDGGLRLKLARTGTKVLSIGQRLQDRASSVDTREGDIVTAPVDFNTLFLQDEEDNQSGDSDG